MDPQTPCSQPVPKLPAWVVIFTVWAYYGFRTQVLDLLQRLSRPSRAYALSAHRTLLNSLKALPRWSCAWVVNEADIREVNLRGFGLAPTRTPRLIAQRFREAETTTQACEAILMETAANTVVMLIHQTGFFLDATMLEAVETYAEYGMPNRFLLVLVHCKKEQVAGVLATFARQPHQGLHYYTEWG